MPEIIGGLAIVAGGGSMSVAAVMSSMRRARSLLGNSDRAVVEPLPADMQALIDQLGQVPA